MPRVVLSFAILSVFPISAHAQFAPDHIRAALEPIVAQGSMVEWQRQHDAASRQKGSGRLKKYIGLGVLGGGVLLTLAGAGAAQPGPIVLGAGMAGGGGVVFFLGSGQQHRAENKLDQLELMKIQLIKDPKITPRVGLVFRW